MGWILGLRKILINLEIMKNHSFDTELRIKDIKNEKSAGLDEITTKFLTKLRETKVNAQAIEELASLVF